MGFFSGKKASVVTDPYGQWNPMQRQLGQSVFSYLNENIGKPQQMYGGPWTADITPEEQSAIDRNARMSALGERGLQPLLAGEWTPEAEDYWQNTIYKPMMKQFSEDILPQIEEGYAGTGGYWGSARAGAVGKGWRDIADTLAAKRGEMGWNLMQSPLQAVPVANQLSQTEAQIQALPRLIKQYGLEQQYEEWKRTRPESQKFLDEALTFLQIPTMTQTETPAESGNWGTIANLAGIALAPFTGGASLAVAPFVAGGVDAFTSPTGQGGWGSQASGALAGGLNMAGFGANSSLNMFQQPTSKLYNESALKALQEQGNYRLLPMAPYL